jgi:hypothetical protein
MLLILPEWIYKTHFGIIAQFYSDLSERDYYIFLLQEVNCMGCIVDNEKEMGKYKLIA